MASMQVVHAAEDSAVLTWAEEGRYGEESRVKVTEFNSSLDVLMQKYLGKKNVTSHVAKVKINGRKFIFIRENHITEKFRNLKMALINKINGAKDASIFLEGFVRDPEEELLTIGQHLGATPFYGSLYGLDDYAILDLQVLIRCLTNTDPEQQELQQVEFLTSKAASPSDRSQWEMFKSTNDDHSLDETILVLDSIMNFLRENPGDESLLTAISLLRKTSFWTNLSIWHNLYRALAEQSLRVSTFPPNIRNMAVDMLRDPSILDSLVEDFLVEIMAYRDEIMAKHIKNTLPSLDPEAEIVVITGFLHMPGLIRALMD